jgi:arylsulfatase A-like enzyme
MPRRALVICFDRWHLGFAGCYGSEFIETPNLDLLAERGIVFDCCYAEHACADPAARACFTGRHQFFSPPRREAQSARSGDLIAALNATGVQTWCVRERNDESQALLWPAFTQMHEVTGEEGIDVPVRALPFSRLVERAATLIETQAGANEAPALLWLASRGVPVPWLPPRELYDLYFEEFGLEPARNAGESAEAAPAADAPAAEDASEQEQLLDAGDDLIHIEGLPLEARYAKALYAAYVSALDLGLGRLLASMENSRAWRDALLVVTSHLGQSMGEHGELDQPVALHEEWLHVPLIVCAPGSSLAGTRSGALVQPADLAIFLLEYFGVQCGPAIEASPFSLARPAGSAQPASALFGHSLWPLLRQERDAVRELAVTGIDRRHFALRTADRHALFRVPKTETTPVCVGLYRKPEDRFELDDVASQEPETVDELTNRARAIHDALPSEAAALDQA